MEKTTLYPLKPIGLKCADAVLLIHHHDVAYVDSEGTLWLSAGIGKWVIALAAVFRRVDLLLHVSPQRKKKQDTALREKNIHLVSLGPPGHYWDRIPRMQRIRKACREAAATADILLIRGLTPRQKTVWRNAPVSRKAFLLVRSPEQNRMTNWTFLNFFSATVNFIREYEFRSIARTNTLIAANSPLYLPELEKLSGRKVCFIPTNTIFRSEFPPLEIRKLNITLRLLFVGRLHNLKGIREFIGAIGMLRSQGIDCIADIAGEADAMTKTELIKMANDLQINDHLIWHNQVAFGPDLFNLYRQADFFILPTYSEGFPRVFWEAAGHSCPVIVTNVGGIPAIVEDRIHGILIPPKDTLAICEAVKQLMGDETLRHKIIEQAYELAGSYTLEVCADKLCNSFENFWKG